MDAVGRMMIHRSKTQPAFQRTPGFFDPLQLFVTQRHIFGVEGIVVAVHHKFSVKAFLGPHLCRVDDRFPIPGQSNIRNFSISPGD